MLERIPAEFPSDASPKNRPARRISAVSTDKKTSPQEFALMFFDSPESETSRGFIHRLTGRYGRGQGVAVLFVTITTSSFWLKCKLHLVDLCL